MKAFPVLFVFVFASFAGKAQADSVYLSLDQRNIKVSLMLRGKALAGQLFEDWLHMNLTSGLEFRFLNHHSFGVDYVYFRNRSEEESQDTITYEYHDNGWSDFDKRQYLLFDYRFYGNFWKKRYQFVVPYFNIFTKQGIRRAWYQKGNIFNRQAPIYHQSRFQEYGIALGAHIGFKPEGRLGIDVSSGLTRNYVSTDFEHEEHMGKFPVKTESINQPWKFHFRLNMFFYLFAKRT